MKFALTKTLMIALWMTGANLAPAQKPATDDIPAIVTAGLDAYKAKGPEEAVKAWLRGSPIEASRDAQSQSTNLLQIQDYYGAFEGFEVLPARIISPNAKVIYMVFDYEKGPLFAKFVVYHAQKGWIVTAFTFNTKEDAVLPSH